MYQPPHRRSGGWRGAGPDSVVAAAAVAETSSPSLPAIPPRSVSSRSPAGGSASHPPSLSRTQSQIVTPQPRQPQPRALRVETRHDSLPGPGPGSFHLRGVLPPQLQRFPSSPGPSPVRRSSRQSVSSINSQGSLGSNSPRRYPELSEMELIASVSRSGGDGAEGDALKDFGTQMRFRAYIDDKIHQYHHTEDDAAVKNIVRLFRKLREGIVASGRLDQFSIEVFESSVRYAVIARDAPQLLSALSGLVPDLYLAVDAARAERAARGEPEIDKCAEAVAEMERIKRLYENESCTSCSHHKDLSEMISHLDLDLKEHGHRHEHVVLQRDPSYLGHEDRVAKDTDNRSHFASLLLIYHLVHSPREVFNATYESLVCPQPRRLKQKDYRWEKANAEGTEGAPASTPIKVIDPPASISRPFTTPAHLRFVRAVSVAMAPESLDPLLFGRMVSGTSTHPTFCHDHPAALERALLSWASPKVRDMAGARLRKAYMTASTGWVAKMLNLEGEGGVMLWAMANGAGLKDGVVKLR